MQLYYSLTSPYARKVRVVLAEKQLTGKVELVVADPFTSATLRARNPLAKVPALLFDDGRILVDSPVICAWLDEVGDGPRLLPEAREARYPVLAREALADGILDAAVGIVLERRRPEQERSAHWQARWAEAISATLAHFAAQPLPADDAPDLGSLTLAIALEYLEFRLPDQSFGAATAQLHRWAAPLAARPSMLATRPPR